VVPLVSVAPRLSVLSLLALTMQKLPQTILSLSLLLSACATTPPIDMSGTDGTLTPSQAVTNIDAARGRRVAWGGTIINTNNRQNTTEIEILGYPLDTGGRPDSTGTAQQRFLIVHSGYLESADYRAGRLVSAVGTITETRTGKVGEAPYTYPVLLTDQLYLWPGDEQRQSESNVRFGIGIGIIFH
jgi:outer membrane lipoprotein